MRFAYNDTVADLETALRQVCSDPARANDQHHAEYWITRLPWLCRYPKSMTEPGTVLGAFDKWLERRVVQEICSVVLAGEGAGHTYRPRDLEILTHCRWLLIEMGSGFDLIHLRVP